MSLDHVKQIIDRALTEEAFYTLLMNRPEETFKDHELTESEKRMIMGLAKSPYTQAKKGLLDTQKLVVAALEYAPSKNL